MSYAQTTCIDVRSGGDDTNNGGMFDPSQTAGMNTDGAATSATSAAPVFTSASYSFVAGDVGAWVYIASGTNWIAGWYQISSVATGAATLNATAGQAVLGGSTLPMSPSTATGCATTGSPTAATWTIDYSQQTAAAVTYTDLASAGAGLTASSAGNPIGKHQVGNAICVTSGTNFNTGRYVLASVAAGVGTFIAIGAGNMTSGAGSGGNGRMGGSLATIATGLGLMGTTADMTCYVKQTTYSITTTLTPPSPTASKYQNRLIGYNSIHGDNPTGSSRPTIATGAGAGIVAITLSSSSGWRVENFIINGAVAGGTKGTKGVSATGNYVQLVNLTIQNMSAEAVDSTGLNCLLDRVESDTCAGTNGSIACSGTAPLLESCYSHDGTKSGFYLSNATSSGVVVNCVAYNNTNDGLTVTQFACVVVNSIFRKNGRDGIRFSVGAYPQIGSVVRNNRLEQNTGYGINVSAATPAWRTISSWNYNGFWSNTSGNYNNCLAGPNDVVATADPCNTPPDFGLNANSPGGAQFRSVGHPGTLPTITTTGYADIGTFRHQDAGGGGNTYIFPVFD